MADIIFHKYLLYIGESQLKQEDCAKIANFSKNLKDHLFQYNKMPHEIYASDDKSNSCMWIYIKSGNSLPYDDNVIDVETNEKTVNPRQITQVELRQQIFALYDYKKQSFYISNTKSNRKRRCPGLFCWRRRIRRSGRNCFCTNRKNLGTSLLEICFCL